MIRFRGALTPDTGVPFLSRLDAVCDRIRRQAKAGALPDAEIELREAHAADAFVSLLGDGDAGELPTASAQPKPGRAVELVLVWDLAAAMRGHTHPGEMCSILGAGPTSDEVVRRLSVGAFVKVVTHDGVKIDTVTHVGRHLPAELRTALHLGAPPTFDGVSCREHGCGRRYGLEWDHVDPVANGGPTSQENLQPLCWDHHQDKTERDRRAGRLGRFPPGNLDFDARAGAGAPP